MEQNGYTEESYEEWKENDMRTELFAESMEELAEKRMLLGVLQDALDFRKNKVIEKLRHFFREHGFDV